jgi:hypothetical protein
VASFVLADLDSVYPDSRPIVDSAKVKAKPPAVHVGQFQGAGIPDDIVKAGIPDPGERSLRAERDCYRPVEWRAWSAELACTYRIPAA